MWSWFETDKCHPGRSGGFQTVKVIKPWPLCEDGSEAKFATFDADSGSCDPKLNSNKKMQPLLESSEVLNKCMNLNDVGSFAFWCKGVQLPKPLPKHRANEGGITLFPTPGCKDIAAAETSFIKADTCLDVGEGLGLQFVAPAMCKNGTKAAIAGFKGKGCDPTSDPLDSPFTRWDDRVIGFCVPTEGINSMLFWCDGLKGLDMRKPYTKPSQKGPNLALILGLSLGLGGLALIILGLFVAYSINYHFRMWVKVCSPHYPSLLYSKLMVWQGNIWFWRWLHCLVMNVIIPGGFPFILIISFG